MSQSNKNGPPIDRELINRASDFAFVDPIITKIVREHYPTVTRIEQFDRVKYKRRIGKTHSVFVYGYSVRGSTAQNQPFIRELIFSAHSDGSRQRAWKTMKVLIEAGFNEGPYRIVTPLAFFSDIQAIVYEAVPGRSLLACLQTHTDRAVITAITASAAAWLKKFHAFKIPASSLETIPLTDHRDFSVSLETILVTMRQYAPEHTNSFHHLLERLNAAFEHPSISLQPCLIYGDFHPDNIITDDPASRHLTMIDFTDVAQGDQTRDIGTFVQQLSFMTRDTHSAEEIEYYRIAFIEQYFGMPVDTIPQELIDRINLYQAWSSLRCFIWLFATAEYRHGSFGVLDDAHRYTDLANMHRPSITIHG